MEDLIIECPEYPKSDISIPSLDTLGIYRAVGGRIIIKELPYYPPIDCSQDGCYEFAEVAIVLVQTNGDEPLVSTLCPEHRDSLMKLQELDIPIKRNH